MTDEELLALAEPFLTYQDAGMPEVRGNDDLVAFARSVMAAQKAELREAFLQRVVEAL